ncbi:MAG: CRISPR-associated endonuclease Cas2 [Thermoplasmatales archaeon]|nr:MAG: CRISPR-associated endonuclease Cas2 [Thermoplasmatales archaeon]
MGLIYIILVYDVSVERVSKVNKFLKRYLIWIQNSVFEGDIKESTLTSMKKGLMKIIESDDKILIYQLKSDTYIERIKMGNQDQDINNVI